ncbi:Ca2+-binding RTX toxin-like protein [Paenibacillus mucilaginosus]|uniref:calcium-binding protein n=1 Tax=Paenibacillus mucilaginosus TaxID=61624 RepID=UPI003D1D18BB
MVEKAANKLVFGTRGNDTIVTSKEGGDRVFASDGNDSITVSRYSLPNDVHGGQGNDIIDVMGERNVIYGELGNDVLRLDYSADYTRVYGNDGNDHISLHDSDSNVATGGQGDDIIGGNGDNNQINAGAGNDYLLLGTEGEIAENNTVFLGGSDNYDRFSGLFMNQLTLYGEEGLDLIAIYGGQEQKIYGEEGGDLILIENVHNSIVSGGLGNDSIGVDEFWEQNLGMDNKVFGDQGDDWIALSNNNEASGGSGNDSLWINTENILFDTTVKGDSGNDFFHSNISGLTSFNIIVDGGSGNDSITAMAEESKLIGGVGQDILSIGGNGVGGNTLTGGQGEDRYIITDLAGSNIIKEEGAAGEVDIIQFAQQGIGPSNVDVSRSGKNLALTYTENGNEETLLVDRFFTNGGYRVERFEFSEGTTWTDTHVTQMVQAMASVTNNSGTSEELEKNIEVQSIIMATDFR